MIQDVLVGAILMMLFAMTLGLMFAAGLVLNFVLWLISVIIAIPTTNNDSLNP